MGGDNVFTDGKIIGYIDLVVVIALGVCGSRALRYEFTVYIELVIVVCGKPYSCFFDLAYIKGLSYMYVIIFNRRCRYLSFVVLALKNVDYRKIFEILGRNKA